MERIIDRVNDYIQYKGMSIRAFENEAGINYSTISAAIKRGTELNTATLLKIIDTYDDIDTEWLMTGEGEMLKTKASTGVPDDIEDDPDEELCLPRTDEFEYINNDNGGKIPLVNELEFAVMDSDDHTSIKSDTYYHIPEFRNADFLLRMTGDSMHPKYKSGDLLACRNVGYDTYYQYGKLHVLLTCHQGVIVGRVYQEGNGTVLIRVKSENPVYPEWIIPIPEIAKVALVVGAISLD